MGTIVVGLVVAGCAGLAIRSIVTGRKNGKSVHCGGDCRHCGGHCH